MVVGAMDEPLRTTGTWRGWIVPLCFLLCGIVWWVSFRAVTGTTLEDAFITYRYAQNLTLGQGFVFNAGQHVLGTTTPLLTMLLALIGKLVGTAAIPLAATVSMICFGVLTALATYGILSELDLPQLTRALSLIVFFGNELLVVTCVGGMETPMVLFLMAASAYSYLRNHPTPCLALCALLAIARPDGIVWGSVLFAALVLKTRSVPWKAVGIAIGVLLPWLAFSTWYFGSPLPHSITAKRLIAASHTCSLFTLGRFIEWYVRSTGYSGGSCMIGLWVVVLAIGGLSYVSPPRRRDFGVILAAYALLYGAFLFLGRAPQFTWYLAPAAWCFVLVFTPGVCELASFAAERLRPPVAPKIGALLALCLVAVYLIHNRDVVAANRENQANEWQTRRAIGLWLRDHTPPDAVVAMEAVGYQAYYSGRAVIDLAGLVSPAVVKLKLASPSNADLFHDILSKLDPDYLVLRSFEVDENRYYHGGKLFETEAQRRYFEEKYQECKRFTAPYPGRWKESAFLTIYGRRSRRP